MCTIHYKTKSSCLWWWSMHGKKKCLSKLRPSPQKAWTSISKPSLFKPARSGLHRNRCLHKARSRFFDCKSGVGCWARQCHCAFNRYLAWAIKVQLQWNLANLDSRSFWFESSKFRLSDQSKAFADGLDCAVRVVVFSQQILEHIRRLNLALTVFWCL